MAILGGVRSHWLIAVAIAGLCIWAPAAWANTTPVCRDASATVQSGQSVAIYADCSDAEGDALYPALASDVAHGGLSMIPGGWRYTPDSGYAGADGFRYVTIDRPPPGPFGADDVSNVATVSIQVTPAPQQVLPDRDGDGVSDRSDDCPSVAGSEDFDGCPPDQDGDDVPDSRDKCPTQDEGVEGHNGCPARWLPRLHVVARRTARAINKALGSPRRRAAFRRTLKLTIRIKLPAGLPRHRYLSVSILPVNIPWGGRTEGKTRCAPGRRCTVVIRASNRNEVRALRRRSLDLRCAVSMWKRGHATDSELAPVRHP